MGQQESEKCLINDMETMITNSLDNLWSIAESCLVKRRVSLTRDAVDISSFANQVSGYESKSKLQIRVQILLNKCWIIPEDSIVEAGAIASSLIENVDICSFLHQEPSTVHVTLGQSMMESSEGGIVGGAVDISTGL